MTSPPLATEAAGVVAPTTSPTGRPVAKPTSPRSAPVTVLKMDAYQGFSTPSTFTTVKHPARPIVVTEPLPPRKRSKVSRACDDCRRKKIRCDAEDKVAASSDSSLPPQCSSCRRNGVMCSFSRIPMKRGPSKRYRSDSLDSAASSSSRPAGPSYTGPVSPGARPQVQLSPVHLPSEPNRLAAMSPDTRVDRLPSIDTLTTYSPASPLIGTPPSPRSSDHRHSWSSATSLPTPPVAHAKTSGPLPIYQPGYPAQPAQPLKPRAASFNLPLPAIAQPSSHGNSYFSKATFRASPPAPPVPQASFHRSTRHTSISSVESFDTDAQPHASPTDAGFSRSSALNGPTFKTEGTILPGWNDRYIDSYYQLIHPSLPILPPTRVQLRARLESCQRPELRQALLCAISSVAPSETKKEIHEMSPYFVQIIQGLGGSDSSLASSIGHSHDEHRQEQVLRLMTLILLYMQTRNSMWLSAAVSLAYGMQLHLFVAPQPSPGPAPRSPGDADEVDSDDRVCRRLFLILVVLDRLHSAVQFNVPLQIPDEYVRLHAEHDTGCFGGSRACMDMVRMCLLLGRFVGSRDAVDVAGLRHEVEALGRSTESQWDTVPMLKALYYFVQLALDRIAPNTTTVSIAITLGSLLDSPLVSVSPLLAYFVPLLLEALTNRPAELSGPLHNDALHVCDYLEGVVVRKLPEFEPGVRQLRSAVGTPVRNGLDGLAHAAHQLERGL